MIRALSHNALKAENLRAMIRPKTIKTERAIGPGGEVASAAASSAQPRRLLLAQLKKPATTISAPAASPDFAVRCSEKIAVGGEGQQGSGQQAGARPHLRRRRSVTGRITIVAAQQSRSASRAVKSFTPGGKRSAFKESKQQGL